MLKSFIHASEESHFPIQNLPFCIFSTKENIEPRGGIRIGDSVLDLHLLDEFGFFGYHLGGKGVFAKRTLNPFMSLGRPAWLEARHVVQNLLRIENPTLQNDDLRSMALHPVDEVTLHLPVHIGNFTDFYASREHATNVGTIFRGLENALLRNWLHLPVGYHGRASSVVLSGTDIVRPRGQFIRNEDSQPEYSPTEELDFELEMGYFVGPPSELGRPIRIENAFDHIFGMVLLNDWSARDVQRWEYRPLGPFLAKNFATTISPWVVTMEALSPFMTAGPDQDPRPLSYLHRPGPTAIDIRLEAKIQTETMSAQQVIARTNLKHIYWTIDQQLAHHASTGCNLQTGDLIGTGTISGAGPDSSGSMLEITWNGERPLELVSGEKRLYLEDGDRITLTGYCQGNGYRVGFGEATSGILPAKGTYHEDN